MQFCLDKHGEWVVVSANDDDKEEDEEDAFFGAKNEGATCEGNTVKVIFHALVTFVQASWHG